MVETRPLCIKRKGIGQTAPRKPKVMPRLSGPAVSSGNTVIDDPVVEHQLIKAGYSMPAPDRPDQLVEFVRKHD